ncbi:MAG: DUF4282 domain-containing protein [Clostridia bacterium]|nr:DUF4282 domain-containing protein [Clostridia bacterium]
MICPKCKTEYRKGYTKCSDCGENLVSKIIQNQGGKEEWLFKFGEITAQKALSILFFLGLFPLLFAAIIFGKYLYIANTYMKGIWFIQNGQKMYTETMANNLPLGVFGGLIFFIISVLVWKVTCELLIIIFRAIETYTKKHKEV